MLYNIAICEDCSQFVEQLSDILVEYQFIKTIDFNKTIYNSAEELLANYKKGTFHILFLDVELNGMDGISLAKNIRNIPDEDVYIVYISNYPKYMVNGYDVKAFHFLQKPINKDKIFDILDKILSEYNKSIDVILIHLNRSDDIVVNIKDIIYIESTNERDHVLIHLTDRCITALEQLKKLTQKLEPYQFYIANRTTIISIKHICSFSKDSIQLSNGDFVQISRHYKDSIHNLFAGQILKF